MIRIIYAAAPLSAPTTTAQCRNSTIAADFCRHLESLSGYPLVYSPHSRIARAYADPWREETPAQRIEALASCIAALEAIHAKDGELHILTKPDGTLSSGCKHELDHWTKIGGKPATIWLRVPGGFEEVKA